MSPVAPARPVGQGPVRVLRGNDASLLADALGAVLSDALGENDRTLAVDEFSGSDYELGAAIDAARTPPFLTDRRVVVIRHAGRFSTADELRPLLDYAAEPAPDATVLVVWERGPDQPKLGTLPKRLADAVSAAGGAVIATDPPSGRGRIGWIEERLAGAPVGLDPAARAVVMARLGDDVAELPSLLDRLVSAFGEGAELGADDVGPWLGQAGSAPPWELTDAIDRGDAALAIDRLHRMLGAGDRHPLQVMATLQSHYSRMLRLDGAEVTTEREAADRLGLKGSTFPARKAMREARALGYGGLVRAFGLLAQADLDLRGAQAWEPELVLEVLVARLARRPFAGSR